MCPKTGRPVIGEPKDPRLEIRISLVEKIKLEICCNELNLSKTDVIKKGIDMVYKQVKKEK